MNLTCSDSWYSMIKVSFFVFFSVSHFKGSVEAQGTVENHVFLLHFITCEMLLYPLPTLKLEDCHLWADHLIR